MEFCRMKARDVHNSSMFSNEDVQDSALEVCINVSKSLMISFMV